MRGKVSYHKRTYAFSSINYSYQKQLSNKVTKWDFIMKPKNTFEAQAAHFTNSKKL